MCLCIASLVYLYIASCLCHWFLVGYVCALLVECLCIDGCSCLSARVLVVRDSRHCLLPLGIACWVCQSCTPQIGIQTTLIKIQLGACMTTGCYVHEKYTRRSLKFLQHATDFSYTLPSFEMKVGVDRIVAINTICMSCSQAAPTVPSAGPGFAVSDWRFQLVVV